MPTKFFISNNIKKNEFPGVSYQAFSSVSYPSQGSTKDNLFFLMKLFFIPQTLDCNITQFVFEVKDIPLKKGGPLSLFIEAHFDKGEDWEFTVRETKENNHNYCIEGTFVKKNVNLEVRATPNVSGTMAMHIWDRFCQLLQPTKVKLSDIATISCKYCSNNEDPLKLKIWRIFGNYCVRNDNFESNVATLPGSWYKKFGFVQENETAEYKYAIKYLSHLTLGELATIYQGNQVTMDTLEACFQCFKDKRELQFMDFPFSHVIQKIDNLRKSNQGSKIHRLFHLINKNIMTCNWEDQNFDFEKLPQLKEHKFKHFHACLFFVEEEDKMYKKLD